MEAIAAARMLGHDEEVLAQARVIATLRAEDNIASWRTGDGFPFVQEVGARWRAADTGDFAALSALRRIYLCSRADAAMFHAEALARLHDIGAARALIDEAVAIGQPDPEYVARTSYYIDTVRGDWPAAAADAQRYADALVTSGTRAGSRNLLQQTRRDAAPRTRLGGARQHRWRTTKHHGDAAGLL